MAPITTPLTETLGPVTETVTPVLEPVTETLTPVLQPVTETLQPVTETLRPVTETVTPVLEPVTETLRPVTDTVTPVLQPVTETLRPVTDTVTPVLQPVTKTVAPAVTPPARGTESGARTATPVTEVAKHVQPAVAPAAGNISEAVPGVPASVPVIDSAGSGSDGVQPNLEGFGTDTDIRTVTELAASIAAHEAPSSSAGVAEMPAAQGWLTPSSSAPSTPAPRAPASTNFGPSGLSGGSSGHSDLLPANIADVLALAARHQEMTWGEAGMLSAEAAEIKDRPG